MMDNTPNDRLRALTEQGTLHSVDAFLSHSWHDDPEWKWAALQQWRNEFKRTHLGREPKMWIDKYCIDQNNIVDSLLCLPVYLSGCNKFVALCGETYLSRLWCIIEIFTFIEMKGQENQFTIICPNDRKADWAVSIEQFQVKDARCFLPEDTDRLQAVIQAGASGPNGVTSTVKQALSTALPL